MYVELSLSPLPTLLQQLLSSPSPHQNRLILPCKSMKRIPGCKYDLMLGKPDVYYTNIQKEDKKLCTHSSKCFKGNEDLLQRSNRKDEPSAK
jgi:hypothetical protein